MSASVCLSVLVLALSVPSFAAKAKPAKTAKTETAAPAKAAENKNEIKHIGQVVDPATRTPLFKYERTEIPTADGSTVHKVYSYLDGKPAVTEDIVYKDGRVVRLEQKQHQLGANGLLEIKEQKLNFSYTKEEKTKTDSEAFVANVATTDEIWPTIKKNWDAIMKGDTVEIRLPVLDRRETVGFKLFKETEGERNGKQVITVKMKPSSFVIAALVNPLHFKVEKEGDHKLVEIEGRTLPKIEKDGKFKDLDAILEIQM